jgi:hypothetical protein
MLKTPLLARLSALAIGLSTAGAFAGPGIQVDTALLSDVDFGIICPAGDEIRIPADGTTLGYITERQAAQKIALTTQTIPLMKGIGFGVRSTNISGGNLERVQITVTHPLFPGHGSTQDVWEDSFGRDSINFNFFTFEFPFEMQAGRWTFSASRMDQPLFFVEFNVVSPKSAPHLAAVCAGPALTS